MKVVPAPPDVVRPWRDGLLAGLAVAAAISFGAWIVYARACDQKLQDVRQQLGEIAATLRGADLSGHHALAALPPEQRAPYFNRFSQNLVALKRGADEVGRVYSFSLDPAATETLLDTGEQPAHPAPGKLPPLAGRVRAMLSAGQVAPLVLGDGVALTAFGTIRDPNGNVVGGYGVEADRERVGVKLGRIRDSFVFACILGLLAGAVAGAVVGQLRARTARFRRELAANRRVEEAIISSLGEVVYIYNPARRRFRWRGNVGALLDPPPSADGEPVEFWMRHIHPDDLARYTIAFQEATATGTAMDVEYRIRRADGSVAWLSDRAQPIVDEAVTALTFAGSLTDISARQMAEESLRLFFEETSTAHLALDGDAIVDANPAAIALFGAPNAAKLQQHPIWMLWPKRQPNHEISAHTWSDKVMQTLEESSARFEWQFLRIDGRPVDCDIFMRHAVFQERDVLMLGCLDLSPAKRAQAQLIESEQRFRDVSQAIGEFIWEVDAEGRFTYASPRVVDVLGVTPEEVIGRHPFDFVPEEDRPKVLARSRKISEAGEAFRNFEHRVRQPGGRILWISASGVPSYDAGGQIKGFRGASLDITQRRAYEQELVLQKNAAEAAGRAKGSFLAMMSHEIRTPLNSVLGFADLLLATPLDPSQREHLHTIRSSGDALLVLLNDILDFSKIESGHMQVDLRPTDLARCLQEAVDLHRPNAFAKKLGLTLAVDEDVPRHILTDSSRLRQILLNLIGNAVKFTAEGEVRVTAELTPAPAAEKLGRLRILVADTGIGISREQQERLFTPFTQADSSTTRRFGGTGLGLAISKRLAVLLGGELSLVEHPGAGATFALELPAVLPGPEQMTGPAGPPDLELPAFDAVPGHHLPRVLVVDDNTLNRRLTSQLLRQLGAENETVASAEECFARLEESSFELILMDVQMPGMDGLEATRRIRRREEADGIVRTPIVALTADAMVGDRERCLAAGMNDYLTKPIRREALARVLQAHRRA